MIDTIERNRKRIRFLTQFSILLAIEAIVCFTPLGSLPIGPLVATLSHIPVIIAALTLGFGAGTLMGFFFGLFSFIVWTFTPPSAPLAFVFTPAYAPGNFYSLLICFLPRILIGVLTYAVFAGIRRLDKKGKLDIVSYTVGGICGSAVNTILVLGGIYIFFGEPYAAANGLAFEALLAAILAAVATNGVLEAALGGVLAYAVCKPVNKFINSRR